MNVRVFAAAISVFISGTAGAAGVPAFSVTAPNGETSVLIGTIHVPYPGLVQPTPAVLDGSKRLVVEHLNTVSTAASPKFPVTEHPVLESAHLDGVETKTLEDRLNCVNNRQGLPLAAILPYYSDYLLAGVAYIPCPYRPAPSRDDILKTTALQKGLPIDTLETDEAAQKQRDQLPVSFSVHSLKYGLSPTTDLLAVYSQIVEAFNAGDFEKVSALTYTSSLTAEEKQLHHRIMVEERNAAWRLPLESYLRDGKAVVVVGAAHLPGKGGLLDMLKSDGFRVQKIELPAQ